MAVYVVSTRSFSHAPVMKAPLPLSIGPFPRRESFRGVSDASAYNSPDTGVGLVGSLVGALVLRHLVRGVDEATVYRGG